MPKCDACGIEVSSLCDCNTGELCNACAESWFWFRGSVFDWCVARHAELRGKQPATQPSPTDAELNALAMLVRVEAAIVESKLMPEEVEELAKFPGVSSIVRALKSRGVIK